MDSSDAGVPLAETTLDSLWFISDPANGDAGAFDWMSYITWDGTIIKSKIHCSWWSGYGVLETWIHRPFQFLGMIGSRRKARLIFRQFLEEGMATEEQLAHVACPVGLDIDSRTVPEIAVSILAQFIQKRAETLPPVERPVGIQ